MFTRTKVNQIGVLLHRTPSACRADDIGCARIKYRVFICAKTFTSKNKKAWAKARNVPPMVRSSTPQQDASTLTAAKDRDNPEIRFKTPSVDQLWSCLQRCLFFEEPSSRWSRLIAQVSRHLNGKNKDLSETPMSEQQECFAAVFGTPQDILEPTARAFNTVLALKDLQFFDPAEFDIWFLSQSSEENQPELLEEFADLARKVLQIEPSTPQAQALYQAWNIVPYWRVLESAGPWAEDELALFATKYMRRLDRLKPELSAEFFQTALAEFDKMVHEDRASLPSNFQPGILILVEGNTEAILLPRFMSVAGIKTVNATPLFIPCGGANQLLRKFLHLRDLTSLPIFCIVDHDAEEQSETIHELLRKGDKLHVWSRGEIEDTFPSLTLLETLNAYLHSMGVSELLRSDELTQTERRTEQLDRLWRVRGLGDFDKVGFAQFQAGRIKNLSDVPDEAKHLLNLIKDMQTSDHGSNKK